MRFYTEAHEHYCGIDLHARTMYVCILAHRIGRASYFMLARQRAFDLDRFLRS